MLAPKNLVHLNLKHISYVTFGPSKKNDYLLEEICDAFPDLMSLTLMVAYQDVSWNVPAVASLSKLKFCRDLTLQAVFPGEVPHGWRGLGASLERKMKSRYDATNVIGIRMPKLNKVTFKHFAKLIDEEPIYKQTDFQFMVSRGTNIDGDNGLKAKALLNEQLTSYLEADGSVETIRSLYC